MWIGDEFGPYLLKFDPDGRLLAVIDTLVDGRAAQSPDHPGGLGSIGVARSKGLEAMAGSPDGRLLYPMLEGPLAGEPDPRAVRILEFDVAAERWTGRHWNYLLEQDGNAIGDLTMIDATTALVIERDNGYGTARRANRATTASPNLPASSVSTRSRWAKGESAARCARLGSPTSCPSPTRAGWHVSP